MKRILLIAFTVAHCNLQAMWLETKIKKMLPKQNYVLSTVVRETKDEEKEVEGANSEFSKSSRPISVATSCTATNNEEFFLGLSDIKQSSSDVTMTSSVEENSGSVLSDYISVFTNQAVSEEVFSSIESARSLPTFNSSVPFYEDDGVFDMEMSGAERSSPKYITSEEYFPSLHRENQIQQSYESMKRRKSSITSEEYFPSLHRARQSLDSQKRRHSTPYEPMKRRKSSIDAYYNKRK